MRSFRRIATAVAAAALAGLAVTASAQAGVQTTTKWFTIDVKPATPSSPALFLATHDRFSDARIETKRYQSGDPDMQWTIVGTSYPAAPDLEGAPNFASILIDAFTCGHDGGIGCDFQGSATARVKLVNRGSGHCISVPATWTRNGNATPLIAADCWRERERQIWTVAPAYAADYMPLSRSRTQNPGVQFCADVNKGNARDHRRYVNSRLQMWRCNTPADANQRFRFLQAGSATCTTQTYYEICGVRDRRR